MNESAKPQLSATAAALLPAAGSAVRCADYNRELAIDSGGTAIDVSALALVELALPWPKPVFNHPFLSKIEQRFQTPDGSGRVLATVPGEGHLSEAHRVVLYERRGGDAVCTAHAVRSADELCELFEQIAEGGADASTYAVAPPGSTEATLVCTQGSHDVCCGTEGVRLVDRLLAADPERTVYRVSHTGGHRFAPTAMTLPDGRMWGGINAEQLLGVLDRTIEVADAAPRCRGWWGAASGWAQMAERAVFAQVGWGWNDLDRSVEVGSANDRSAECVVTSGERTWDVVVEIAREIPTIACRAEGGLPAKVGREYGIRSIVER